MRVLLIPSLVYAGCLLVFGGMFVGLAQADGRRLSTAIGTVAATVAAAALLAVAMITAGSG